MNRGLIYRMFDFLSVMLIDIIVAIGAFAQSVLRTDYGYAWRAVQDVGAAAYRNTLGLHPVYRESYETHGMSLARRRSGF